MIISSIKYIKSRLTLNSKLSILKIKNTGVDEDEIPFIELENGKIFFGLKSSQKDKKYYNILPKKMKRKLPFYAYKVALDIVIRYYEAGLMLGGPKKEMYYKVKADDYIAEMGAYMGHYTIYLSEKVGNTGKVIAIEPIPDNIKILEKNIKANNITNVSIVKKGVWKEKDEMTFNREEGDTQSSSLQIKYKKNNTFTVPVDSLDNILEEQNVNHIDFMLIQLNGVEYEALMGLTKIEPKNFAIAARYSEKGKEETVDKILKLLNKRDYTSFVEKEKFVFSKK